MLWQRLLFGSLMIAALVGLIGLDAQVSQRALAAAGLDAGYAGRQVWCALPLTALVAVLVMLAVWELGRLFAAGGYHPVTAWAVFVSAGLAVGPWLAMQRRLAPPGALTPLFTLDVPLELLWLAGGFAGAALAVLARRTTERAAVNLALTLFAMLYLGLLASFVVRIRCLWPGSGGSALVVYYLLTVKAGDIGAYFTGMAIGRHKLVPWLSPGKTIEGAVGALVFASAAAAGGMAAWPHLGVASSTPPLDLGQTLVFGVAMAVFGHIGDLIASAIKRDVGTKDSGRVVPAFGGLLDLFDSPVFAAPAGWFLLTLWA